MARVLVADDSDLDIELTRRALKKVLPGWEVDVVENGALVAKSLTEGENPRLVLLDYKMPGVGAPEILASMGAEYWNSVPAIIFSSSVSPSEIDRCKSLGAQEYVEKPTDPTDYTRAIELVCQRWLK